MCRAWIFQRKGMLMSDGATEMMLEELAVRQAREEQGEDFLTADHEVKLVQDMDKFTSREQDGKVEHKDSRVRGDVLDEAKLYVTKDRNSSYDEPENNFARIANLWDAYLSDTGYGADDAGLHPHDVAIMMALMKIARLEYDPYNRDSWVDAIGYLACGAECAEV